MASESLSLERAWQLYRFRRYPAALEAAVEFLAHHPQSPDAHCLIALIHAKEKREEKAIAAAQAAITFSPDWDYTHYIHALVTYWFNCYFLAMKSLSEAMRLQPTNADYHELLASIHYEMGHYQTSVETAQEGLEHHPEHVGCLYRAGVALFDLKKKAEARRYFDDVLRLEPEHASAQGFMGCYLVEEGRFADALPGLRLCLRENPQWTFMQTAWKEALRGSYPWYGVVARFRQLVFDKYPLRSFVVLLVIMNGMVYLMLDDAKRDHLAANAFVALLASFGVAVFLFLSIQAYLSLVSQVILFSNRELRLTFSWKEMLRKHWKGILLVIYLAAAIIVGIMSKRQ